MDSSALKNLTLVLCLVALSGLVTTSAALDLGSLGRSLEPQIIAASSNANSAKAALKNWLNCFVTGDGGTFYDMLPSSAKTKFDQWFTQLSSTAAWHNDPESAKVPTSRQFMILAFEEAKKQGGLNTNVSEEDFAKVAETCQMSGSNATFTGLDGTTLQFFYENDAWRMDNSFANNMVDGIIQSVGDLNQ